MPTALQGAVIVKVNGQQITYKQKCEKCGNVSNSTTTTPAPTNSYSKTTSSFRCLKCGNQQKNRNSRRLMKSKTELLDDLFLKWVQAVPQYKGKFVKDGIVNELLYSKAPTKVLFLAKEPNNPDQEEGDYRTWWKEQVAYTFSYRISEWSYGILNNFPQFDDIYKKEGVAPNPIQHISFMNIKKSGGGGNAEYERMMEHLKINYDLLHKQIDIISPDIIITGTSWQELRNGLFPNVRWQNSGYGIDIGRHKNSKVIDFYHPSSRTAPSASYSLLQNIINSPQFKQL